MQSSSLKLFKKEVREILCQTSIIYLPIYRQWCKIKILNIFSDSADYVRDSWMHWIKLIKNCFPYKVLQNFKYLVSCHLHFANIYIMWLGSIYLLYSYTLQLYFPSIHMAIFSCILNGLVQGKVPSTVLCNTW